MAKTNPVHEILNDLAHASDTPNLHLGDLVKELGTRGFGPLFALMGLLVMLPTGAIPGLPALVGVILILLAGQILIGMRTPWLPRRIERFRIDRDTLKSALERGRPWAARLGRVTRARLAPLTTGPVALRLTAGAAALAGTAMIPIGFIPFLPFILGLPVLALGLGLMARDGLFIAAGHAGLGGALAFAASRFF